MCGGSKPKSLFTPSLHKGLVKIPILLNHTHYSPGLRSAAKPCSGLEGEHSLLQLLALRAPIEVPSECLGIRVSAELEHAAGILEGACSLDMDDAEVETYRSPMLRQVPLELRFSPAVASTEAARLKSSLEGWNRLK